MKPLSPFATGWAALSELLDEALGMPAQERAAWVERLGDERAVHREALRALLEHQAAVETDDFLNNLPQLDAAAIDPSDRLVESSLVGVYRLIREVGQGGMGTVWLAERADGTMKRRVALKLPRTVWGDGFAERLAREREILATLEHEHIARLYDAGVDAQGRPFLAMEYIEGEPIDAWCRAHATSIRGRIELLLQVAAAVTHAHARLVVHRDLKPGNILVSEDARVHLLDFGIAKLLAGDVTSRTALTELGARAFTLDYASPEQIRGEALGTASDVYSLAVVAYELLAGSKPYRLKRSSAAELEEAIATVEPPLASNSATDRRAARQLRGDVDSILNKGLKKLPGERYQTMEAFANDLRRYLAGEPVGAQPDRLAYRARKFVGRYRLHVGAGAVVGMAVIAGLSVALWQAREARLAAQTALAVQSFIESVFRANSGEQIDPAAARTITARELLDQGAERIDKELASAPEAQMRLYALLAEMYQNMSLNERSLALTRQWLAVATRLYGRDSDESLRAAAGVGYLLHTIGRSEDGLSVLLEADATARHRVNDRDRSRMLIDMNLAAIYFNGDLPKGLERARSAAAIARTQGPSLEGLTALHSLGENARRSGHLEESRQALAEAVTWIDRRPQGLAGELGDVLAALGDVESRLGEPNLAQAAYTRALAEARRIADPTPLHTTRLKWARFQKDNGLLREALETAGTDYAWARKLGLQHEFGPIPARVTLHYAQTLVAHGDAASGLAVVDEAFSMMPKQTQDGKASIAATRADALASLQRPTEAVVEAERAVSLLAANGDKLLAQNVYRVRRRCWQAAGKAVEALQDFYAHPAQIEASTTYARLRREAEEAILLSAADRHLQAGKKAFDILAALEGLPERRFTRDVDAQMTAVAGVSLLRNGRVAESLPLLEKALSLHVVEFDAAKSPAVVRLRLELAEARRRVVTEALR